MGHPRERRSAPPTMTSHRPSCPCGDADPCGSSRVLSTCFATLIGIFSCACKTGRREEALNGLESQKELLVCQFAVSPSPVAIVITVPPVVVPVAVGAALASSVVISHGEICDLWLGLGEEMIQAVHMAVCVGAASPQAGKAPRRQKGVKGSLHCPRVGS